VINPRYAKESTWLQLFIDEAKLSANLVHGNIVQIYHLGEVDGQYYMAMEYISGPTLRMVIERHRELDQRIPPTAILRRRRKEPAYSSMLASAMLSSTCIFQGHRIKAGTPRKSFTLFRSQCPTRSRI
jgi:serine/threonine protein kinase